MTARIERWRYKKPFAISRCVLDEQLLLYATLTIDGIAVQAEAEAAEDDIELAQAMAALARVELPAVRAGDHARIARLPAGPIRNVLDCLLWDLDAKRSGERAWTLAEIDVAPFVETAVTIVLDTPEAMGREAATLAHIPSLKVKLGRGRIDDDIARAEAVADSCTRSLLLVDPNGAWSADELLRFLDATGGLNIGLIEQPLPPGADEALTDIRSAVPICADESCTTVQSLAGLVGRYQAINIKLDKTGGFTEALAVAREARRLGFQLMTGCNGGTSLAIAPAYAIASLCDFVDLDGPLLLRADRPGPMRFEGTRIAPPLAALWG